MATTEGNDLIKSVREPGGNVTGIRVDTPALFVECFKILMEIAPKAKRIWLTFDPDYPAIPSVLGALRPVAEAAGVTLVEVPVKNVAEIEADLAARSKSADTGVDAVLMMPGISHAPDSFAAITKFCVANKLPIAGGAPIAADNGDSVFTYLWDNLEAGGLAAALADKILNGVQAGTIPLITAEPRLRLNYRLIKSLGLEAPEGLLSRADKVIH
jgi:putative ABC transport system substrate-binding protein